MRISTQGDRARCSVCRREIYRSVGGRATAAASGPALFLCTSAGCLAALADLVGSMVADTIAHSGDDCEPPITALNAATVLADFTTAYNTAVAG